MISIQRILLKRCGRSGPSSLSTTGKSIVRMLPILFILTFFSTSFAAALLVSWNANSEADLAGYKLYYGTEQANYTESVDVGSATSYIVENLTEGQTYYFVLTAYDLSGNESAPSDEASATVIGPQTIATASPQGVTIQWSPIQGADSYNVYRNRNPYAPADTLVATVTENSFLDSEHPRTKGIGSYYTVKALAGGSEIYTFNRLGVFNVALTKGRNLVSLPLIPADSSITSVLGSQLTGSTNSISSDLAMVWNGTEYEAAWLVEGTASPYEGKWVTQSGDRESPLVLTPDMSFWIVIRNNHADSIVMVTGSIHSEPARSMTLARGQNFLGCPFPTAVPLAESELAADGVVMGSSFSAGSDQLRKWTGSGWEIAWLVRGTGTEWDGKWMNGAGTGLSTMQFEPGKGYLLYIKHDNPNKEWTIPNPDPNL